MSLLPLADILESRSWTRYSEPFPHVLAHGVFTADFYRRLCEGFARIASNGVSEGRTQNMLSRNIPGYDAYGLSIGRHHGDLAIFMTRPWHDLLAGLCDLEATGHVNCGLHHHAPDSRDGWVHNDLNPGWFPDSPLADDIQNVRHDLCRYTDGVSSRADIRVTEHVRAVAMIFYLCNGPWTDGDGGETGLYKTWDQPVRQPCVSIAPIDNTMLAFECTPYSFHSFIGGNRRPRNSVILWLHRPKSEVSARWGPRAIREWPRMRRGGP
jgi:hypothetical protein